MATKTNLNIKQIADSIKNGKWEHLVDIEISYFYTEDESGKLKPDPSKRFQIRDFYINKDFVNEKVEYVNSTGDRSEIDIPTVINMPDGNQKLDDGSHTLDIERHLNYGKYGSGAYIKAYCVDYEKHLGGKDSNAYGLGNLLNIKTKEKQTATQDNIKNHFLQMIAEKNGVKLTDEESDDFVSWYQGKVNKHTLGQWYSRTPEGGRHSIAKEYTDTEKREMQKFYSQMRKYRNHYVTFPSELEHAKTSILGSAIVKAANDTPQKNNILILLYCKNNEDIKRMTGKDGKGDSKWKTNLERDYSRVSELTNLNIEYEVLDWEE